MNHDTDLIGCEVRAVWEDSHYVPGWHTAEPATQPVRCVSLGRLVYAGPEAVTIAGHWTEEGEPQRCGEMTIPRKALVSLRALQ